MAKFFIPLCLLLLALVHSGYSLKCYACESKNKQDCGEHFVGDKIPYNECPTTLVSQDSSCMKLTTEGNIKRYCLNYPKGAKPCEHVAAVNPGLKIKECLDCHEDGCNSAYGVQASTYVMVATCIMALANHIVRA